MSDAREMFLDAIALVSRQTQSRSADDWAKPSPCEGWDARDVLVHVTGTVRKVMTMLDEGAYAATPTPVEDAPAPDVAISGWQEAAREALPAVQAADPRRLMETPLGQVPLETALALPIADCAVHAWDIAASAGESLDLPDTLLAHLDRLTETLPAERDPQSPIGPAVAADPDASETGRRMAALGRARPQNG